MIDWIILVRRKCLQGTEIVHVNSYKKPQYPKKEDNICL